MSSYWSQFEKATKEEPTKSSTSNYWSQFESVPSKKKAGKDDYLKEKLEQPAAYTKGLGKGFSQLPGAGGKLLAYLANQLTPEDAPWKDFIEGESQKVMQTQTPLEQDVASQLEKKLPSSEQTQFAEKAGERTAPYLFSGNPLLGMLMGGAGQIAEEAGVGPLGQMGIELGTGSLAKLASKLPQGIKAALKTTPKLTEEGLQLPKAATAKPPRLIRPSALKETKEAALGKVGKQTEEILAKAKEKGIPLSTKYTSEEIANRATGALEHTKKLATDLSGKVKPIRASNVENYLQNQKKILKKAKVPAKATKEVLEKLNKFEAMYDPLSTHTPEDMVNQFREINKDLRGIYKNYHITGAQDEMKQFLEGLSKSFTKDIEQGFAKEKGFVSRFKQGNTLWSEYKKLQEFEGFMDSISEKDVLDPTKFRKEVMKKGGKNKIIKSLGKEQYERLNNIAKDIQKTEVGLKGIKEFDLTKKMVSNYVLNAVLKLVGLGKLFKTAVLPVHAISLAKGYLLTRPSVYRNTRLLLNAVKNNRVNAIPMILEKLNKETKKSD